MIDCYVSNLYLMILVTSLLSFGYLFIYSLELSTKIISSSVNRDTSIFFFPFQSAFFFHHHYSYYCTGYDFQYNQKKKKLVRVAILTLFPDLLESIKSFTNKCNVINGIFVAALNHLRTSFFIPNVIIIFL